MSDGLLHYEDLQINEPMRFGPIVVTRDDIIAFARTYDPQPIHLDEEAAKQSIVGGLCASGAHSCGLMMRLLCDHWLNRTASLGAPGIDYMKWLKPVRPGDALSIEIVFSSKRVLGSRPDVGMAQAIYRLFNQAGERVLESSCPQLIRLRTPTPVAAAEPGVRPKRERAALESLWDLDPASAPKVAGTYFEDRAVGELAELGSHTFGADEIITFARQFDPQPFHLDEAAGRRSLFGGLAASGWHTYAHFIRAVVTDRMKHTAAAEAAGLPLAAYGPSPGFRDLRWLKPVMAGDTISYRQVLIEKVEMKSRPTRGILVSKSQGRNQTGDVVFEYIGMIIAERRTPSDAPAA